MYFYTCTVYGFVNSSIASVHSTIDACSQISLELHETFSGKSAVAGKRWKRREPEETDEHQRITRKRRTEKKGREMKQKNEKGLLGPKDLQNI